MAGVTVQQGTMAKVSTTNRVVGPEKCLDDIPGCMRDFSLALRSLYAEKKVLSNTEAGKKINELRDATRRDAATYAKGILPICTKVVRSIKECFENCDDLKFEDFQSCLSDIIKDVEGYIQVCGVAVDLHKDKLEDDVRKLMEELKSLNESHEEQIKSLSKEAANTRKMTTALRLVPGVNAATPLLKRAKLNVAVHAVRDALIPGLSSFISGLEIICGFFNTIKGDLVSYYDNGKDSAGGLSKRRFLLMQRGAREIMGNCSRFFAVIPAMETDLAAIPDVAKEDNYVDKWLKEREKQIRKEYKKATMTTYLSDVLGGLTGASPGAVAKVSTSNAAVKPEEKAGVVESLEARVAKLATSLKDLPGCMRLFSLALRSLYAENQVSSETEIGEKINELRDATRRDAVTYANGILPICTKVVRSIKEFFETYDAFGFEAFQFFLPDIIKEVEGFIQVGRVTVNLHKDKLRSLQQRAEEARMLLKELNCLNESYEEQMKGLSNKVTKARKVAMALRLVPGADAIATPLLEQVKLNEAAVYAVRDALIPGLDSFISGLGVICGFFGMMKGDLESYHRKGKDSEGVLKRRHFILMQRGAKEIMGNCSKFSAVIPTMEADLAAIPDMAKEDNYGDRWLKESEKQIREEYEIATLTTYLSNVLEGLTITSPGTVAEVTTSNDAVEPEKKSLGDLPGCMRLFCLTLRSLYAENQVSSETETGKKINKLRDATRRDAATYAKGILPICMKAMRSIIEFFENYDAFKFQDFQSFLPDKFKDVEGYIQVCRVAVSLHKDILRPLEQREDEAKVLIKELKSLNELYEERMKNPSNEADNIRKMARALSFVPTVNAIAAPLLLVDADTQTAQAWASAGQVKLNEAAVYAVRDVLIPGLNSLISGLGVICELFKTMKGDLESYYKRGKDSGGDFSKRHFLLRCASKIMSDCSCFFAVIPSTETDLAAIPDVAKEDNYVDEWLKKKKKEIRKEHKGAIMTTCLSNALE